MVRSVNWTPLTSSIVERPSYTTDSWRQTVGGRQLARKQHVCQDHQLSSVRCGKGQILSLPIGYVEGSVLVYYSRTNRTPSTAFAMASCATPSWGKAWK